MELHPEAAPARRNLRKRALLDLWLKCPPVVVVFDGGAPGVDLGKGNRDPNRPSVHLNIDTATLGDEAITLKVRWQDSPDEQVFVRVPYAAIHTITCSSIRETMQWEIDLKAAEARAAMYTRPMNKMLH